MVVITIIFLLATFGFMGMGIMSYQQKKNTAQIQLAKLGTALENYHKDMGAYPTTVDTSTGVNVAGTAETAIDVRASGSNVNTKLYNILYLDGALNGTTIYCADLSPSTKSGWEDAPNLMDPWGKPYRYRSAFSGGSGGENPSTVNPDFDLWTSGKDGRSDFTASSDDIRNLRMEQGVDRPTPTRAPVAAIFPE